MKKVLLLLVATATMIGCSHGDDILTLQGQVGELQRDLMQSDINNAALAAQLAERIETNAEAIADNTSDIADTLLAVGANTATIDSITAQALAYAEVQATINVGLQTQVDDLKGSIVSIQSSVSSLTAADTAIDGLIEDLEDDLDDLEDDIARVNRRIPSVTIGTWAPSFTTQVNSFSQTADTFLNGVPAATATRHILVSASLPSTTGSVTTIVYTGTVSGTGTTVGTHTVTSTSN